MAEQLHEADCGGCSCSQRPKSQAGDLLALFSNGVLQAFAHHIEVVACRMHQPRALISLVECQGASEGNALLTEGLVPRLPKACFFMILLQFVDHFRMNLWFCQAGLFCPNTKPLLAHAHHALTHHLNHFRTITSIVLSLLLRSRIASSSLKYFNI